MKKVLFILSLFASLCGSSQNFQDYAVQQWADSTLRMEFYPPWPAEPFQVEKFNRHLRYDLYSDTVRYECLVVPDSTPSQYVISADEWGGIHKVHVDSLMFSELQNMQQQIQELYAIIQADYALERTVFFDMQGNEIDPATAKCEGNYVAHVYLEGGQCIKRKYSRVE